MFVLIHKDQIKVGPRTWSYSFFNEFLKDNNINYTLSFNKPSEPIFHNEFKILPYSVIEIQYDPLFEELVGPKITINKTNAIGTYTKKPLRLEISKDKMKEIVSRNRYNVETMGCEYTFPDNEKVLLNTNRVERSIYFETLVTLPDNATVNFKFSGAKWRVINKEDISNIIAFGSMFIQEAFTWEATKYLEIENATIENIRDIELQHPLLRKEV